LRIADERSSSAREPATASKTTSSRMPRPHFFVLIVTLPIVPVNLLLDRV
jgi:hypothetical protein